MENTTMNISAYKQYLGQGYSFLASGMEWDALDCFKRALLIYPRSLEALSRVAIIYEKMEKFDKTVKALERILEIQGDDTPIDLRVRLFDLRKRYLFWDGIEKDFDYFSREDVINSGFLTPFSAISTPYNNEQVLKSVSSFSKRMNFLQPRISPFSFSDRSPTQKKIRLGFVCGDFRKHPTGYVIGEFFELIDRNKFDVYLYDIHPDPLSAPSKRIYSTTPNVFQIDALNDRDAAQKIFDDKIDVLIDLMGHTRYQRLGIYPYRPAPAQGTFLGFLGTLGNVAGLDYHFVDRYSLPEDQQKFFTEKIKYVEPTNWIIDRKVELPQAPQVRHFLNLDADKIVLCCFNNAYKYTPNYFDLWARILKRVDNAILWFYSTNKFVEMNIMKEFQKRQISSDRIVISSKAPHTEHLARFQTADLLLDTEYYNAHTTGMEALYMGCPIITCPLNTLTSRAGGALLTALEVPELICKNIQEYEDKVVQLCQTPGALKKLREKVIEKGRTSSLFDMEKFTRSFEKGCIEMFQEFFNK